MCVRGLKTGVNLERAVVSEELFKNDSWKCNIQVDSVINGEAEQHPDQHVFFFGLLKLDRVELVITSVVVETEHTIVWFQYFFKGKCEKL